MRHYPWKLICEVSSIFRQTYFIPQSVHLWGPCLTFRGFLKNHPLLLGFSVITDPAIGDSPWLWKASGDTPTGSHQERPFPGSPSATFTATRYFFCTGWQRFTTLTELRRSTGRLGNIASFNQGGNNLGNLWGSIAGNSSSGILPATIVVWNTSKWGVNREQNEIAYYFNWWYYPLENYDSEWGQWGKWKPWDHQPGAQGGTG